MTFGSPSLYLWLLAALASVFMLQRGYSLLSWLWHLPERMPKRLESQLSSHGELELLKPLPSKESMAMRVAKMMLLVGALFLAYDVGARNKAISQSEYRQAFASWKQTQDQETEEYNKAMAIWKANRKENK